MAAKITGNFEIDNNSFRFTAIAFGRIGGQNVGVKLSKTTEKTLRNTDLGKELHKFDTLQEMFDDLGI